MCSAAWLQGPLPSDSALESARRALSSAAGRGNGPCSGAELCSSKPERLSGRLSRRDARPSASRAAPIAGSGHLRTPPAPLGCPFCCCRCRAGPSCPRRLGDAARRPKRPSRGAPGSRPRLRVICDLAWRLVLCVLAVSAPHPRRRRDDPSEVFCYSQLQATLSGVQWAQQTRAGCPILCFKAQSSKLCKMKLIYIFAIF